MWLAIYYRHFNPTYSMDLPAAVNLTAITAFDLEQHLEQHLAASDI